MVMDLPMEWAVLEWGSACLGDRRLTARAVRVGAAMLSHSGLSLPKQMEDWSDLMGAYRLFGNERVTHAGLSSCHWSRTRALAARPGLGVVLFVQDSTTLDYGTHRQTSGLGFVGNGEGYGIELHSALCVLPGADPQVVGLAHQSPWTRPERPSKQKDPDRRKRRTEHDIWEETLQAIGQAPPAAAGTLWVSVGDRGSDVFSYMSRASELGWHTVVRSKSDRVLSSGPGHERERRRLHEHLRALAPLGETLVRLRARPGVGARSVLLKVAWASVALPRPQRKGGASELRMGAIRVWEERAPGAKGEPLEWILLTSLPLEGLASVLEAIGYYRSRWLIEEYHKCLKTGCRIQERQVATRHKLFALLGLFGIVAVYLLRLKAPLRGELVPSEFVRLLQALKPTEEDLSDPKLFWRRVAMLGGFLGRKGDADPGWQSIWAGWSRVQDILVGFHLAASMRCV